MQSDYATISIIKSLLGSNFSTKTECMNKNNKIRIIKILL